MIEDGTIQRQAIRELRGSIIRILNAVYGREPDTVTLSTLKKILRGRCDDQMLRAEVKYLEELGYLASVKEPVDALDESPIELFRLRPYGKQLINGDRADPSVQF